MAEPQAFDPENPRPDGQEDLVERPYLRQVPRQPAGRLDPWVLVDIHQGLMIFQRFFDGFEHDRDTGDRYDDQPAAVLDDEEFRRREERDRELRRETAAKARAIRRRILLQLFTSLTMIFAMMYTLALICGGHWPRITFFGINLSALLFLVSLLFTLFLAWCFPRRKDEDDLKPWPWARPAFWLLYLALYIFFERLQHRWLTVPESVALYHMLNGLFLHLGLLQMDSFLFAADSPLADWKPDRCNRLAAQLYLQTLNLFISYFSLFVLLVELLPNEIDQ